jgi:hypothetical protein
MTALRWRARRLCPGRQCIVRRKQKWYIMSREQSKSTSLATPPTQGNIASIFQRHQETYKAMTVQFTLYAHAGPNALKVAILLEKLGLSYNLVPLEAFSEDEEKGMKGKRFLAINPNGRRVCIVKEEAERYSD